MAKRLTEKQAREYVRKRLPKLAKKRKDQADVIGVSSPMLAEAISDNSDRPPNKHILKYFGVKAIRKIIYTYEVEQ